jgi:hypothetical protein
MAPILVDELRLGFKKEKPELMKKPSKLNVPKIEKKLTRNIKTLKKNPKLE